ncbi:MAG: hypothetical protein SVX43_09420 [Cyanobacteriota bacterium]|nr:hypothetical protein [Cyanobacteriota bacterium]
MAQQQEQANKYLEQARPIATEMGIVFCTDARNENTCNIGFYA